MKNKHLTFEERKCIERMLKMDMSVKMIAKSVGKTEWTIYHEIKRGSYDHLNGDWTVEKRYSADRGQAIYEQNMLRCKPKCKIDKDPKLKKHIEDIIKNKKYSPYSALQKINNSNEKYKVTIKSVNTIYNNIRSGKFDGISFLDLPVPKMYRKRKRVVREHKREIKGLSIEERPEEVNDRKTFGHWEMDCVIGQRSNKKTLLVLTERKTRYEIIEVMKSKTAYEVVKALNRIEKRYYSKFYSLFKTITIDNGAEFSSHKEMSKALYRKGLRCKMYYCHPNAPFERGTNEVQNRFIRRFYPKGSDFDKLIKRTNVNKLEEWVNNYPRKIFNGRTSKMLFDKCCAELFNTG